MSLGLMKLFFSFKKLRAGTLFKDSPYPQNKCFLSKLFKIRKAKDKLSRRN